MKKINNFMKLGWVLVLGVLIAFASCDDDESPENSCPTFSTADSVCFCTANPMNASCIEVAACPVFTPADSVCFCTANPLDASCIAVEPEVPSYMDNAVAGITFEGVTDVATVFENGTTGGTFNGETYDAWAEAAAVLSATIETDGGSEGDDYLSLDIEVLTEGWAWIADVNWQPADEAGVDVSALEAPHFVFAAKSDDVTTHQFEFEIVDTDGGQGGFNTNLGVTIGEDWTVFAVNLEGVHTWNWGDGPNWAAINRVKTGVNLNNQTLGSIYVLDVDAVGIIPLADLPEGTVLIEIPAPVEEEVTE